MSINITGFLVKISTKDYELGLKESNKIGAYLRNNLEGDTIVLGPTMASVFKINNVYHYQIIIKWNNILNKRKSHN